MSNSNVGCILFPLVLAIVYLLKLAIAIAAYALAAMMTVATIFWLTLIVICALFKRDGEYIVKVLLMWFLMAHAFTQRLFKK